MRLYGFLVLRLSAEDQAIRLNHVVAVGSQSQAMTAPSGKFVSIPLEAGEQILKMPDRGAHSCIKASSYRHDHDEAGCLLQ